MRLIPLSVAIALALTGCSSGSDHLAPVLISTKTKPHATQKQPTAAIAATSSTVQSPAPQKAAQAGNSSAQETELFKGLEEPTSTLTTESVKPVATPSNATTAKVASGDDLNLAKQIQPHFPYLRVTRLIPGRLRFDAARQEFVFRINQDSLIANINTLMSVTEGQAIYDSVSENHVFPNSFEIRGQTVSHLIDQMVGPFKKPSQILQDVRINNLVLIHYSRGMSAHAI